MAFKPNSKLEEEGLNQTKHVKSITYVRVFEEKSIGVRIQTKDHNVLKEIAFWFQNSYSGQVIQNNKSCITLKRFKFKIYENSEANMNSINSLIADLGKMLKDACNNEFRECHYHWTLIIADKLAELGYEMISNGISNETGCYEPRSTI